MLTVASGSDAVGVAFASLVGAAGTGEGGGGRRRGSLDSPPMSTWKWTLMNLKSTFYVTPVLHTKIFMVRNMGIRRKENLKVIKKKYL